MSSPTPDAPRYADKPVNTDHRLRSGTVVGIVIACIVAAVAATAAVLFTGPEHVNEPPTGVQISPSSKPQAAGPSTVTAALMPERHTPGGMQNFTSNTEFLPRQPFPQRPPSSDLPLEAFEFGNGLPLQIPDDWEIVEKDNSSVLVGVDDQSGYPALCNIMVGEVKVRDIAKVLATDLKGMAKRLDNFQADTANAQSFDLQGQNFTEAVLVPYSGDFSGQKGTIPLVGMVIELFNPDTGLSAFLDYFSPDQDTLKARAADVDTMINSMV